MKFCAYLKKIDDNVPAVFKGGFLNYKALKKFIKYRARRLEATPADSYARDELALTSERDIFFMLCSQLKEVDRRFEKEAGAIIAEYDGLAARRRSPAHFLSALGSSNAAPTKDSNARLQIEERVAWARKYARINALALRKIAKKHDKLMHSRAGHVFLQGCWKGEAVVRCFLGGPLHAELAAVQDLLHQSTPSAAAANSSDASSASHAQLMGDLSRDENDSSDQGHLVSTQASSREDSTCPICLDLLYDPVALACGHQFCGRCAISAAGHAATPKVLRYRDLQLVRTRDAVCPICRAQFVAQGELGVFEAGAELPHVGQLIKHRFPQEWQERHAEAVAEQAKRAPPRKWYNKDPVSAFDVLR